MTQTTSGASQSPSDGRCPVINFDHHSAEFNSDPHAGWMALKDTPVAWSESYGGYWVISDHAANQAVLQNPEVFTSERIDGVSSVSIPAGGAGLDTPALPIEVDPPYQTKVRALLNSQLSPGASRKMQPLIEHWVDLCIDGVIEKGECDLLADIVGPIPAFITMTWLGYPEDQVRRAQEIVHHMVGYPQDSPEFLAAIGSLSTITETLFKTCLERRADPKDDLISWLMTQELDGEPVDDATITGLAFVLVFGGVDTTTSLLANSLIHLQKDLELRRRLIEEPELLEPATEEFLRFYPPLASMPRKVRSDFEYRGCPMRAGDPVLVSRYGANFDEKVFDDPQEFRVDRFPNRHASFGMGPHRCVGSHLARLMYQTTMRQVLARIPDFNLDLSEVTPYPDRSGFNGWTSLPATFTAGPRLLETAN